MHELLLPLLLVRSEHSDLDLDFNVPLPAPLWLCRPGCVVALGCVRRSWG
jgi:hypothetical protein